MKADAVSVVIPSYQRGTILLRTLDLLLGLEQQPGEILVVDQTETQPDDEAQVLTRLDKESRICWMRQQPPGVVGAMNRGLREAKGDIVLFLDDDIIPSEGLVAAHRQAHEQHADAWAVVGQVLQPEDTGNKMEVQHAESRHISFLTEDLDFRYNGTDPGWVTNVMAGNLSVDREKALALGGFDQNFIPPVSFRFETEFAKRIIAAGGRIRFEPSASIRHLRVQSGGTRSQGSHLTSASPFHGVGDYYYALRCGKGWDRIYYMLRRPIREVCNKFHLRHPWWIPLKFFGELRALVLGVRLHQAGAKLLSPGDDAQAFYDAQYAGSRYAAYGEPVHHPFYAEINRLLDRYGNRNGKWLEVGCGRGLLQDVVDDYSGVDVSTTVAAFLHKTFCCARAEALPFEDRVFDGLWSYAVLEHVENPEQALMEMRRVLKPGGILFLAPAWQCRPWAASDSAWKPWHELSLSGRLRKALIPVRECVVIRAFSVFPRRLYHLLLYFLKKAPIHFVSQPLTPNYTNYNVIDADARHHMDPFDAILWFRSRGDRIVSHHGWRRQFIVRTGVLVIQRGKSQS